MDYFRLIGQGNDSLYKCFDFGYKAYFNTRVLTIHDSPISVVSIVVVQLTSGIHITDVVRIA